MTSTMMPRRRLLAAGGAVTGGALLGAANLPAAGAAAPGAPADHTAPAAGAAPPDPTATSWPTVDAGQITPVRIEGSDATVLLVGGAVATVLRHVARRFHYEVAPLGDGDASGWQPTGSAAHRSGTAIALHPARYPAGVTGGLFPTQLIVVRDILAECAGVVRWGGDDRQTPQEGHFRIDVPPGDRRLAMVAAAVDARRGPGAGAGSSPDPLVPGRRAAARTLESLQRRR
ncbi:hypothetical protein O7623_26275 [Solwaraspora sp. WMMD791]|uniref:hypothetical protein n=1 Tax=Solwaraspora sp. WMMD791 TaxID=3016086 RepID=UPI00249B5A00|nr:hypothetical protein [Solwaraspora sp. WMMD791]WFE26750.1 hypothetical protein O7623_26275 [Solwaraspora sp. WMMD791]